MPPFGRTAVVRAVLLAGLVAGIPAGCGSSSGVPEASTADFEGTVAALELVHVTVADVVAGDPGCDDRTLASTAISFSARGLDQPQPVRVYLYRFRDDPTYDRLRPTIDQCARAYVTDPDAYAAIDAPPLVMTSPGPWAPDFAAAMRTALTRASRGG